VDQQLNEAGTVKKVGAGLPAMAVYQSAFSVIGTPSSQASQLPQWIE
jgi:hypothetical protein